jgi:large subunit ribosomal protein L17
LGYRRLGFRSDHRRALLRNSVTSLLEHEKITTTETRAKEISSIADKMITLAKRVIYIPVARQTPICSRMM